MEQIVEDNKTGTGHHFDLLKEKDLWMRSITELRHYATHHLKVARASKILGGKAALIRKIEEARTAA